jgi:hypothetical protein
MNVCGEEGFLNLSGCNYVDSLSLCQYTLLPAFKKPLDYEVIILQNSEDLNVIGPGQAMLLGSIPKHQMKLWCGLFDVFSNQEH